MQKLDVGIVIEKTEGDESIIRDVCFIKIITEQGCAEIIGDSKNWGMIYPLARPGLDSKTSIIPGLSEVIFNVINKDYASVEETVKALREENVGKKLVLNKDYIFEGMEDVNYKFEVNGKELSEKVKNAIVGQDEVVDRVVSNIIYNQKLIDSDLDIDNIRLLKKTMFIYGKTGTGKTEIIKQIAKELDIPYVIEDATKFTVEGYVGRSVSDMLKDLVERSATIEQAERGILIIDEMDKKRNSGGERSDVTSTGVQTSLLRILDGSEVIISEKDVYEDEIFDTSFLTVIMMGACQDIVNKKKIGFQSSLGEDITITEDDLIEFGFIPELVGRVSSIIKTNDLGYDDFIKIITDSSISPVLLEKEFLKSLGINLVCDNPSIDYLAKEAMKKNVGARGIKKAFEEMIDTSDLDILAGGVEQLKLQKGERVKVLKREEDKKEIML